MPSFWLSLFFLWSFWLIFLSASTPPSLALPKAPYFLLYSISFYYLLVQAPVPLYVSDLQASICIFQLSAFLQSHISPCVLGILY